MRYDHGMTRGRMSRGGGDWTRPGGNVPGYPYDRGGAGERPGVGGYRGGYQGGSGGMRTSGPRSIPYGRDYWWLGEHELRRHEGQRPRYDESYRRFDNESHPRYSPVGGMYPAMGGRYAYGRAPRPLREDTWFSDWTRWF